MNFQIISEAFFMLGIFTLIFISPSIMSFGLFKLSLGDREKLNFIQIILCCIPVFNLFYSISAYNGRKSLSLSGIGYLLIILSIMLRIYVMYFAFENENFQTYTIILLLVSILAFWLLNSIDIFKILLDSGVYTTGSRVINSLSIIMGQITIGIYLPKKIQYYENN